jgi:hypothetical protein
MFHSETMARVIHADRVRDLERAARDRRLLAEPDSATVVPGLNRRAIAATPARTGCGDSAGVPA